MKQVTSGWFSLRHGRRERVADIGVGDGWDTGNEPATSVSAIRKVFAIKELFAREEALAIGKRPEFMAVEAGRRHGQVFSAGVACGAL